MVVTVDGKWEGGGEGGGEAKAAAASPAAVRATASVLPPGLATAPAVYTVRLLTVRQLGLEARLSLSPELLLFPCSYTACAHPPLLLGPVGVRRSV